MSSFEKRKDGFERKFAHDQDLEFRSTARRNKLLGLWAAELLGKTGEAAADYAKEIVKADLEEAGHEDVVRRLRADFDAGNVQQSDHQIRRKMDELMGEAVEQIENES